MQNYIIHTELFYWIITSDMFVYEEDVNTEVVK